MHVNVASECILPPKTFGRKGVPAMIAERIDGAQRRVNNLRIMKFVPSAPLAGATEYAILV